MASSSKAAEKPPPADTPPMERGRGMILVAEDEKPVLSLVQRVLAARGCKVATASSGLEAMPPGETCKESIDLLLTDVVMPEMGGPKLAEHLSGLHPEMKVMFMSGYTDDEMIRHGILADQVRFLHKPFTPKSLLQSVSEALTGAMFTRAG